MIFFGLFYACFAVAMQDIKHVLCSTCYITTRKVLQNCFRFKRFIFLKTKQNIFANAMLLHVTAAKTKSCRTYEMLFEKLLS